MDLPLTIDGRPLADAPSLPEYAAVEFAAVPPPGATLSLELGAQLLEPFLRPGDPAWRWRWVAPGAAGLFALLLRASWPDGRTEELRGSVEVAPRKLDRDRYAVLLDDLQRLVRIIVGGGGGEIG